MSTIPRIPGIDSTLALLKEGNTFIPERCNRYHTDLFQTRLMLKKAVFMSGEEPAKIFYDTNLFKREGAAPMRLQKTLFGQGGVQGLDGKAHQHRKQMFMSLMGPDNIRVLIEDIRLRWHAAIPAWAERDHIELFYETSEILCRAACHWAGVPLQESDVAAKTKDFMALIDGSGGVGPRHWRGRRARTKLNKWITEVIEAIRAGQLTPAKGSAAASFAQHRDLKGELLPTKVAAVELNNIIRPIIAIGRFITFSALALHDYPHFKAKLEKEDDEENFAVFVQEVRRFYPFFPMVAAIAKTDFDWRGYHFAKGQWVILDLYGTNHDARSWQEPDEFRPERFREWDGNPYNFIPQGGGDHYQNHRCAGEWITIEVMKAALRILTQEMDYDVPRQNLHVDLTRLPAIPESRFVMTNVRLRQPSYPQPHNVNYSSETKRSDAT